MTIAVEVSTRSPEDPPEAPTAMLHEADWYLEEALEESYPASDPTPAPDIS